MSVGVMEDYILTFFPAKKKCLFGTGLKKRRNPKIGISSFFFSETVDHFFFFLVRSRGP
jgi:hypothetical protein